MSYTITKKDLGVVEINLKLPAAEVEKTWKEVVATFAKTVTIPGFRAGHAPDEAVAGKVGQGRIYNEVASSLIGRHLGEILDREKLRPLDNPKIKIDSLEQGKPFDATVSFTPRPAVKVGSWRTIKAKRTEPSKPSGEEVGKSIKNIFEAWVKQNRDKEGAKVNSSAGSPRGDSAELGQTGQTSNVSSEKFIYDASGNKIYIKDEKTNPSTSSGRGSSDRSAGSPHGDSAEPGQAAIDDEWAKKLGARDLDHLRELVRTDLATIAGREVERQFEQEVFGKLLALTEVAIPEVLVEDELGRMIIHLTQDIAPTGQTLEEYLKKENKTVEDLRASWRAQARDNVKLQLALDEIARELGVTVSPEEVEKQMTGNDVSKLSEDQKENLRRYLAFALVQSKTVAELKKVAEGKVTEAPGGPKESKE